MCTSAMHGWLLVSLGFGFDNRFKLHNKRHIGACPILASTIANGAYLLFAQHGVGAKRV